LATNSTHFRVNSWNSWQKYCRVFRAIFPWHAQSLLRLCRFKTGLKADRDPDSDTELTAIDCLH